MIADDVLQRARAASLLQCVMRLGRLADEEAVRRIAAAGGPVAHLRTAHTRLLPHLSLAGVRPSELARRLGVSKQAVGPLVDDLVAAGVIERTADPADGRAILLRWTAAGREAMLHGLGVLGQLEAELAEGLTGAELAALRGWVHTALARAERWGEAALAPTTQAVPP